MARALDVFAVILLIAAMLAFAAGIRLLGDRNKDFDAVYLLIVGALALRASTELLRPRGGAA
jgi:hypothetical protein